MSTDWQDLHQLLGRSRYTIERVRLDQPAIVIEGSFEPPPLAQIAPNDQVFVAAFIRCHGSIKKMETLFGVSYPTIKARLNRLAEQLSFVEIDEDAPPPTTDVLGRLERGEIDPDQALELLEQ